MSLIVGARYLPKLQHQDLQTSAQQIARERGTDTDANRKVYLPVIRAYRVGPELVAGPTAKICVNWVFIDKLAVTLNVFGVTGFWQIRR